MSEIDDLIDALQQTDFNQAKSHFDSLMSDKVGAALDAEKINVAAQIFNGVEPEDDEDFDDISDEEVEEILADDEQDEPEDDSDNENDSNS